MIIKSIRARIQLWHTALLATFVGGLLVAYYIHEKELIEKEVDRELTSRVVFLLPHYAPRAGRKPFQDDHLERRPPARRANRHSNHPRPPAFSSNAPDIEGYKKRTQQKGIYFAAWGPDGKLIDHTENTPKRLIDSPSRPKMRGRANKFLTVDGNREHMHANPRVLILLGRPESLMHDDLEDLIIQLLALWAGVVALGFGIGWWLVSRSLQPITKISDTAENIALGRLHERISTQETDSELGKLAEVLNNTFSRLDQNFEQQVRFTADASHELKTPIAVILANCQFALRREREPEKYRDALQTCETSAKHIKGLVSSLLELAKIDSGEFQVTKSNHDLYDVASASASLLSSLADKKSLLLKVSGSPSPCVIDSDRIQQVAINLISNAIKYTKSGEINISVDTEQNASILRVSDTGSGIAPEELPFVFDRFYRSNKERSDDRRSTGLGLAITKAIVDAHGGSIKVSSTLDEGSTFTVTLPHQA